MYNNNLVVESEALIHVKLPWSLGGNQVAVTGSWDNWETRYQKKEANVLKELLAYFNTGHFVNLCSEISCVEESTVSSSPRHFHQVNINTSSSSMAI